MRRTELTELLLDFAFAAELPGRERMRGVSDADWSVLARCAEQHRLEPTLHDRLAGEAAVPEAIRGAWRDAYRLWTMKAAAARVDLRETVALLDAAGMAPLALKGAFLAWHAYPAPALRPLRDIDVLVPADRAADAHALLREHGWSAPGASAASLSSSLAQGKHLVPLVARCGTVIELHHRLWEREGELDHRSPLADDDAIRARAIAIDGIRYPCPEDMVAHLIVHAVYSHRLDCGPLLLSDMRWLLEAWPVDGHALRARAVRERWEPGLDLIAALSRRYPPHRDIALRGDVAPDAPTVPEALVEAAADLLLQELDTRRSAGLAATALVRGVAGAAGRVGRGARARLRPDEGHDPAERLVAWTGTRLRRTIGELIDPAVREQARDLSRLSKWLGA